MNDLTYQQRQALIQLIQQLEYNQKYNKLAGWTPYLWQKAFVNDNGEYKQRYLRAGNRCGKSYTEAHDFAMHITGLYPDWFTGEKIEGSGHYFWAIGHTIDSTTNVLQDELFGTKNAKIRDEIGTGAIPQRCIDFEYMIRDGKTIKQCRIKHFDESGNFDGYNTIQFFAAEAGTEPLMGQSVKYAWLDEEPRGEGKSTKFYNQLVMRTVEASGWLTFTSTPEQGFTELNRLYEENKNGDLKLTQVDWDMCPHLTPEMRKQILSGVAEWAHNLVMKGLPVIGSGAVFPFDDSDIMCDPFPIPDHYLICAGMDIGSTADSSTVMYAVMDNEDPSIANFYLFDEWEGKNKKDPSLGNPDAMARFIKHSAYSTIPLIPCHDAGTKKGSPEAYATKLRDQGINVSPVHFHNPVDSKMLIDSANKQISHNNPETGLVLMRQLMAEGRLKIFSGCTKWFEEKRGYYYKENYQRSKPDHMQDAGRLALVSLLAHRGVRADQCTGGDYWGDYNHEVVNPYNY